MNLLVSPALTGDNPPMSTEASGEATTGVTWSDIYESPQVDRSLRRLPRLCQEAVRLGWAAGRRELLVVLAVKAGHGLGLAGVLPLGKGVLDEVIAAGSSGEGAGEVLPRLLLLTVVTAGLGFLSAIGREPREILAELASRHAQSQIIEVACAVGLEAYDTPGFHNRLVRAAGGGQFRPWQVVEGLTGLAGGALGVRGGRPAPAPPPALAGAPRPSRGRAPAAGHGQGRRADVPVPPQHDRGRAPPQLPLHAALGQ